MSQIDATERDGSFAKMTPGEAYKAAQRQVKTIMVKTSPEFVHALTPTDVEEMVWAAVAHPPTRKSAFEKIAERQAAWAVEREEHAYKDRWAHELDLDWASGKLRRFLLDHMEYRMNMPGHSGAAVAVRMGSRDILNPLDRFHYRLLSPDIAIDPFLQDAHRSPVDYMVVGDRGSGKTSWAVTCMDRMIANGYSVLTNVPMYDCVPFDWEGDEPRVYEVRSVREMVIAIANLPHQDRIMMIHDEAAASKAWSKMKTTTNEAESARWLWNIARKLALSWMRITPKSEDFSTGVLSKTDVRVKVEKVGRISMGVAGPRWAADGNQFQYQTSGWPEPSLAFDSDGHGGWSSEGGEELFKTFEKEKNVRRAAVLYAEEYAST